MARRRSPSALRASTRWPLSQGTDQLDRYTWVARIYRHQEGLAETGVVGMLANKHVPSGLVIRVAFGLAPRDLLALLVRPDRPVDEAVHWSAVLAAHAAPPSLSTAVGPDVVWGFFDCSPRRRWRHWLAGGAG
jgi:hypothetical protein